MLVRAIASRLTQGALLLLLASLTGFALVRMAPGDPGALTYGSDVAPADLAQLRERWGLDAPLHLQYLSWLANLLQGDFGRSYVDGRPVLAVIAERIPATLQLTLSALVLAAAGGAATGALCALRAHGPLDRA